MILVDYSAVSIGACAAHKLPPEEDLLRHMILNNLRAIYKKNKAKYGEMILCCDHASWRRDYFEQYKYERRASREGSKEDQEYWAEVFRICSKIRDEIRDFIPWKVIHIHGAEGDDVIGALAQSTQDFGNHQDVLIVAADSDYKQLQIHKNVKQFNPALKKAVKEKEPHKWLFEAICKGQSKDGIPNIKTGDNFYVDKAEGKVSRQSSISSKALNEWWDAREDLENTMTDEQYRNYVRNRKLIDFNYMPEDLREKIMTAYRDYETPPFGGVLKYLMARRCKNLIDHIEDFR